MVSWQQFCLITRNLFCEQNLHLVTEKKESEMKVLNTNLNFLSEVETVSSSTLSAELADPRYTIVVSLTIKRPQIDPLVQRLQAYLKDGGIQKDVDREEGAHVVDNSMVANARAFRAFYQENKR